MTEDTPNTEEGEKELNNTDRSVVKLNALPVSDKPNPVGRPPLYTDPIAMQTIIDAYFEGCKENRLYAIVLGAGNGSELQTDIYEAKEIITDDEHPTMSGLAYALEMDRQSLLNYSNQDNHKEFFGTIKRAKARVERYVEQKLYGTAVTGLIFNLKNNFDWKDKTEVDQNTKVSINIDSKDADCA